MSPETLAVTDGSVSGAGEDHRAKVRPVIVIVDSSVGVTGGLRAAARMARNMSPWADTIIALPRNADIPEAELVDFGQVVRLPVRQIRKSLPDLALFAPALLSSGWRLARLAREVSATVLVVNDFNQMQGVAARWFGYQGRLVTIIRCDPRKFPRRLADLWLKAAYLVSDQLVAVSDFVIRRVPPTPKLCRIYDALDLHLPMGLHAKPRPGSRDVVQIANYISDKGHEHVLNAFVRVAHKHPHSRLVFYGGDMGLQKNRAFRASLEERAAMSGFGERIEFHGFARDVTAALESASVVCNFSKSEALSFTCIEAGQLGLPVVAFRSGGPEEIIVDGETGFLCDIGDIDCAAARIDHLLAHPDEAVAMGRAAVDHVSRTFGNDSFVAAMRNALAI